jgi:hypothetical protein
MHLKIRIKHIWNRLRLYLSFSLLVFYLVMGCLFLFSDEWIHFISKGREIIGTTLVLFGILRFYLAYRRFKHKHIHIKTLISEKKEPVKESQDVTAELDE